MGSAKSGAVSPTFNFPARALFHMLSNGNNRNGVGPVCFMTLPNVSGGCRMA